MVPSDLMDTNHYLLQTAGAKDVGIETYTFSKTFNMAGWRIGFAGNADMIKAINVIQDHLFVSLFQLFKMQQSKH